jgi:ABC-2 type transport system permease protein
LVGIKAFREVTPDSLQYLIDDMFENITLFSNRVVECHLCERWGRICGHFEAPTPKNSGLIPLGKQTEVPLIDYIDIGVFAQTESKKVFGKPLVYERIKITQPENTFTYRVKEKPHQAGIDPYNYLDGQDAGG